MEIELKYRIPDDQTSEKIWKNELFADLEEDGSREELDLVAKYYDTRDQDLADNRIAYRVRKEGEHYIATLKWQGRCEDGVHFREELAVPVQDYSPNIEVFNESDIGDDLAEVISEKELLILLETDIHRKRYRIDTGTAIMEISVDRGSVVTENGSEDIREVEIELFTGETEELVRIGEKLRTEYGLETEEISKYARGIAIIKNCYGLQ